jgi:hypothetical protein
MMQEGSIMMLRLAHGPKAPQATHNGQRAFMENFIYSVVIFLIAWPVIFLFSMIGNQPLDNAKKVLKLDFSERSRIDIIIGLVLSSLVSLFFVVFLWGIGDGG